MNLQGIYILTLYFRSPARAPEDQEVKMARFSASVRDGWITTSLGCSKKSAGVQERLKVEDVVVCGGRLPHGFLRSKTSGAAARTPFAIVLVVDRLAAIKVLALVSASLSPSSYGRSDNTSARFREWLSAPEWSVG